MMKKISRKDWEVISAYLDDQLKPRDRARLESRLKADSNLRKAVREMHQTRALLRSMPSMKAPRNFTLTRDMVGQPFYVRLFPAFRLASAIATILFALVVAGDLFGFFPQGQVLSVPTKRLGF